MPYESSPSPVAPEVGSRLWTVGASAGVACTALIVMAVLNPAVARELLIAALVVAVATWAINARRARPIDPPSASPDMSAGALAAPGDDGLLDAVFEAMVDPILLVTGGEADDIAGRRVRLANGAARDLLKIQREGALLVSVLRDPKVLEAVDEALFGGVEAETEMESGGARQVHWRVRVQPLDASTGERLALLILRDETDQRRMAMMRVDFLANASHELKTPLASLTGFIETLKGHAREDAVARDRFLDIMSTQANRMSRLVSDLLSLSRIELNEHIPPSGRVDLALALADVMDAVALITREKRVEIVVTAPAGRATVIGDRDEIVQVLQNLIDNAVKYSPVGGRVDVELTSDQSVEAAAAPRFPGAWRLPLLTPDRETDARYAAVTVRDRGPGLAREHLPRLTERFYRVEGQKSGERPGTGLGLAIVKHIANRHRGGLIVESLPGQGAAFTAYFPAPEASGRSGTAEPQTRARAA
ncbi:sensor histidine kinase [Brevundimonas balnearis]|uniref:histidine kinase n=1 Tax=Brevundimonas balnearis TaxID=1572858 RepID=A0ABV6QZM0_9CAUL